MKTANKIFEMVEGVARKAMSALPNSVKSKVTRSNADDAMRFHKDVVKEAVQSDREE